MTDTLPGEYESIIARRPGGRPSKGYSNGRIWRISASGYITNYTSLAGFIVFLLRVPRTARN